VAGERVKLVAAKREKLGSAESRRLRRQGLIPGVLYGRTKPVAISVAERDLRAALTTSAGTHAVLDLTVDGGASHSAILKEFQLSKVRGKLTHVDLQEVRLVEALPLEMPEHLDIDVSAMHIGDTLRLTELRVPESVKLLDDPEETVLATVTLPTREVEPEPVEGEEAAEGEEAEAGAEGAEAEAAAEGGEPAAEE
jgi:large subunit ribosomal protein L25